MQRDVWYNVGILVIVSDKLLNKWDDSPLIWEMPGKILWANKSKRGDQVPWTRSLSASP